METARNGNPKRSRCSERLVFVVAVVLLVLVLVLCALMRGYAFRAAAVVAVLHASGQSSWDSCLRDNYCEARLADPQGYTAPVGSSLRPLSLR